MNYLKIHYVNKLNEAKDDLGEDVDCFGKPLKWYTQSNSCNLLSRIYCVFLVHVFSRYPGELAWQINLTRRFIRRSGVVSNFHKFLIHESEMVCC